MIYKIRPVSFVHYRLLFIVMTFCIGFICLAAVVMELLGNGVTFLKFEYASMLSIITVAGATGLAGGVLMLYLMKERRVMEGDRRKHTVAIDFPDRRIHQRRTE